MFTRLLVSALLMCCLPAFAQNQQSTKVEHGQDSSLAKNSAPVPALAEPSKDVSNTPAEANPRTDNGIRVFRADNRTVILSNNGSKLVFNGAPGLAPLDGQLGADTTCFTIRSYVVARDSKDSDTVHPKGYSTCQKASRYRVKTAAGDPVSLER